MRRFPLPSSARLAASLRLAAAARREQRLGAGVVVFADVREEQALLEGLARLVELGEPLDAPLIAALDRIAAESSPPPLRHSLAALRALAMAASARPALHRPGPRRVPVTPSTLQHGRRARRGRGAVAARVARIRFRGHPDAAAGVGADDAGSTASAPARRGSP